MNICLSHSTAFAYWRIVSLPMKHRRYCTDPCFTRVSDVRDLLTSQNYAGWNPADSASPSWNCSTAYADVLAVSNEGFKTLGQPMHFLVPHENHRSRMPNVCSHVANKQLPDRSIVRLDDHICLASPQLSFVQQGYSTPVGRLAAMGCEFAGNYRIIGRNAQATNLRQNTNRGSLPGIPLFSADDLRAYVDDFNPSHNSNSAQIAAQYVRPGAESPPETGSYLMFHMPQRFGGVAFPSPDLNSPFKPGEYQRAVTSKSSYRCDLYWSEHNLAVEYDSDDYHTGSDRIADDAERRNSLAHLGIETITITKHQLYNSVEFLKVAKIIGKKLGVRVRIKDDDRFRRNAELRRQVLYGL